MLDDVGAEEEAEEALLEDLNDGDEANGQFVELPYGQISSKSSYIIPYFQSVHRQMKQVTDFCNRMGICIYLFLL